MIIFFRRPDGSIRDFSTPQTAAISLMEMAMLVLKENKGELFIRRVDEHGNEPPMMSDVDEDRFDDYALFSLDDD